MGDWALLVNGVRVDEPYAHLSDSTADAHAWMAWQAQWLSPEVDASDYEPTSRDWGPLVVPEGSYFILGDDRNMSLDSRYRGFVDASAVVGNVRRVHLSLDPVGLSLRMDRAGRRVH